MTDVDVKVNADAETKKTLGLLESVKSDEVAAIVSKVNASGTMQARITQEGVLDISRLLVD